MFQIESIKRRITPEVYGAFFTEFCTLPQSPSGFSEENPFEGLQYGLSIIQRASDSEHLYQGMMMVKAVTTLLALDDYGSLKQMPEVDEPTRENIIKQLGKLQRSIDGSAPEVNLDTERKILIEIGNLKQFTRILSHKVAERSRRVIEQGELDVFIGIDDDNPISTAAVIKQLDAMRETGVLENHASRVVSSVGAEILAVFERHDTSAAAFVKKHSGTEVSFNNLAALGETLFAAARSLEHAEPLTPIPSHLEMVAIPKGLWTNEIGGWTTYGPNEASIALRATGMMIKDSYIAGQVSMGSVGWAYNVLGKLSSALDTPETRDNFSQRDFTTLKRVTSEVQDTLRQMFPEFVEKQRQ